MTDSRVFVTQVNPRISYAPAEKYGQVVFLTSKEYQPEPIPARVNHKIFHEIERGLADYVPGVDYILLSGSPVTTFLAGKIVSDHTGPHKILKWNNRTNEYEVCTV